MSAKTDKVVAIRPSAKLPAPDLRELWAARELVWALLIRHFKTKYKQTFFGGLWALVPHMVKVAIYTIVFGELIKVPSEGFPYPVFVFSGVLVWSVFTAALLSSGQGLHSFKAMIAKVYFPRLAVAFASSLFGIVDFLIALVALFILLAVFGVIPAVQIFLMPIFVIAALAAGLGLGLWINTFIGKYRDFRMGLGYFVSLWLYCTPVIYPASIVPEKWQALYNLNPMVGIVEGFRWSILGGSTPPTTLSLSISLAFIVIALGTGLIAFERAQGNYIDRM